MLTEHFRTRKATVCQGKLLSFMLGAGSALGGVLYEMGKIGYSMLRLKFDVPDALCFGKVMSVQSCCGLSECAGDVTFQTKPKTSVKK